MSTDYKVTGNHYGVYCECNKRWDVYQILESYGVADYCLGHAIKKLLRCGKGTKSERQDIEEAISTLTRKLEMMDHAQ